MKKGTHYNVPHQTYILSFPIKSCLTSDRLVCSQCNAILFSCVRHYSRPAVWMLKQMMIATAMTTAPFLLETSIPEFCHNFPCSYL